MPAPLFFPHIRPGSSSDSCVHPSIEHQDYFYSIKKNPEILIRIAMDLLINLYQIHVFHIFIPSYFIFLTKIDVGTVGWVIFLFVCLFFVNLTQLGSSEKMEPQFRKCLITLILGKLCGDITLPND